MGCVPQIWGDKPPSKGYTLLIGVYTPYWEGIPPICGVYPLSPIWRGIPPYVGIPHIWGCTPRYGGYTSHMGVYPLMGVYTLMGGYIPHMGGIPPIWGVWCIHPIWVLYPHMGGIPPYGRYTSQVRVVSNTSHSLHSTCTSCIPFECTFQRCVQMLTRPRAPQAQHETTDARPPRQMPKPKTCKVIYPHIGCIFPDGWYTPINGYTLMWGYTPIWAVYTPYEVYPHKAGIPPYEGYTPV